MVFLSEARVVTAVLCFLTIFQTSAAHEKPEFTNFNTTGDGKACDQSENNDVCLTGTRLYQLLSYEVESCQILPNCILACNDSYSEQSQRKACEYGCYAEVAAVEQRQTEMGEFVDDGRTLMQRAMQQQMLSHWMFAMITGFDIFNDWYDSDAGEDVESATYVVVEQSDNLVRISSYRVANHPFVETTAIAESGPVNPYVDSEDTEPCYTKSTYSRLVLCMLLFSSGMFLVWLTCSTVTTAPRQSVQDCGEKQTKDDKKALRMLLDVSLAPVHLSKKSLDDEEMLLA